MILYMSEPLFVSEVERSLDGYLRTPRAQDFGVYGGEATAYLAEGLEVIVGDDGREVVEGCTYLDSMGVYRAAGGRTGLYAAEDVAAAALPPRVSPRHSAGYYQDMLRVVLRDDSLVLLHQIRGVDSGGYVFNIFGIISPNPDTLAPFERQRTAQLAETSDDRKRRPDMRSLMGGILSRLRDR